jgi:uncharacterized lipoprotein YbaY
VVDEIANAADSQVALVSGRIIISPSVPAFGGATAHIFLEDISYADADAEILSHTAVKGIHHPGARGGGETVVPFKLSAPGREAVNPRRDYSVRVWIDVDGDGQKGANDLYSDEVYPVLTRGFGSDVVIKLNL